MNLEQVKRAAGERMKSVLASSLVIVLAVASLMVLAHLAEAQAPPSSGSTSQASPAALPAAPAVTKDPEAGQAPAEEAASGQKPGSAAPSAAAPEVPAPPSQGEAPPTTAAVPSGVKSELPTAPWPPNQGAEVVTESSFVRRLQGTLMALALVSLLIWGLLRLLGPGLTGWARPARGGSERLLNVLERQSLGPGRGLLVVEAAGRRLLLGMTEHGITHLADLDVPAQAPAPAPAASTEEVPPEASEPTSPTTAPPPGRNLVSEVLARHLSAVPGLNPRQRGS